MVLIVFSVEDEMGMEARDRDFLIKLIVECKIQMEAETPDIDVIRRLIEEHEEGR